MIREIISQPAVRFQGGSDNTAQPDPAVGLKMPSGKDTFDYGNGRKTTVESLIGSAQIFRKINEILNKAQSSVFVDIYNFQSPELYPDRSSPAGTPGAKIQGELVDRLTELQKDLPHVKVIMDNHFDDEGGESYNSKTIAHLRKNGVDVATYPDLAKISHVKVIIVDNKYAVVGGMNWGNHSPANHDAALYIEGPDVRNIYNKIFRNDWLTSGRKATEIPRATAFEEGKVKVLLTSPKEAAGGPKDEIFQEIIKQIGNAKDSIYAELFVLTQQDVVDNLIVAHRRLRKNGREGVKILVDPGLFFAFPNTRKGVQRLAKAGVPIRFYEANRDADEKLHGKWAVFDRKRLLVGSANWSNLGLLTNKDIKPEDADTARRISRGNHETALLVESESVARPFVNQALYDWLNHSFPILEYRDGKWRPITPENGTEKSSRKRLNRFA